MALSDKELLLAREIDFDEAICSFIKSRAPGRLKRMRVGEKPADGLSMRVKDGEEAERLINSLRPGLAGRGYRAFWSRRHADDGLEEGDEVVVLKTSDPLDMVRLQQSDGANYEISTDDIINRLIEWQKICEFDVIGASRDWVALQFQRLPDNICAFAEEVYAFCPDSVIQGVGLLREEREPERFRAARELCPHVSEAITKNAERRWHEGIESMSERDPNLAEQFRQLMEVARRAHSTTLDMGIRLLAHDIYSRKYLFLWWD